MAFDSHKISKNSSPQAEERTHVENDPRTGRPVVLRANLDLPLESTPPPSPQYSHSILTGISRFFSTTPPQALIDPLVRNSR